MKGRTKLNCWEFKNCGREPGGRQAKAKGVCPAATDSRLDGVHGGKNAGRACWVVAGTLCGGEVQGDFGRKYRNCEVCDFYKEAKAEERGGFQLAFTLLGRLKSSQPAVQTVSQPR